VVRAGVAVLVLAALGAGIAIGLLAKSSTPKVPIAVARVHKPKAKNAPLATTTTTAVPATTTTTKTATTAAPVTTTTAARTTTTVNAARAILSPATTPPVVNECSVPISLSADGSPYPFLCQGGGINVLAWQDMAANYPMILALGSNASESQALQTMCDVPNMVGGEVSVAGELAAAYYGWPFANDPAFTGWYPDGPDCSG
jgi:hypothetical protein